MPGLLLSINTSDGGLPKLPRHQAEVTTTGLDGDRQRNRRLHGGPDRAVCVYSFDLIRALRAEGHPISIGEAGENLTVQGVDWDAIGPGARLVIGGVRLFVTSFTVPCRHLTDRFRDGRFGRVSQTVHPGWSRVYARVEQPGLLSIGDPVTVEPPGSVMSARQPAIGGGAALSAPRRSIRRIGTVDVACAPAHAFVYFTPDGERLWVPGFDPEYLHPFPGEQRPGAIFMTTHGGEDTLWMILRFSPGEGMATYARVTPGSRRGTVRVALTAIGHESTRATISYDLTALSDAGDGVLAAMSETAYTEMLSDWERRIAVALAGSSDCRW
jgi:MOSC domain-containing protein YiiM